MVEMFLYEAAFNLEMHRRGRDPLRCSPSTTLLESRSNGRCTQQFQATCALRWKPAVQIHRLTAAERLCYTHELDQSIRTSADCLAGQRAAGGIDRAVRRPSAVSADL